MSLQSLFYQVTGPNRRYYHMPMYWGLCLVSWAYETIQSLRAWAYAAGFLKAERPPVPVISVGNLTLGGTGKTPFVMWVAEILKQQGLHPVILSRGYGGETPDDINLVTDGESVFMAVTEVGDEPSMMALKLTGIPILVGSRRVLLARHAVQELGADVLVLDDGFQHLPLERDANLLLLDFKRPLGNGQVFPAGEMREGWQAAGRADAVIWTRADPQSPPPALEFPPSFEGPRFKTRLLADTLVQRNQPPQPLASLKGKKLAAFCGIVQPDDFFALLEEAGADLVMKKGFPDHYDYPAAHRRQLVEQAKAAGAEALITTEKDIVKWNESVELPLMALSLRLEVLEGEQTLTDFLLKTVHDFSR